MALVLAVPVSYVGYKLVRGGSITPETCGPSLTRATLEKSLELGNQYLVAAQQKEGNFVYEYDWVAKKNVPGESPTRQAGATWGLGLAYKYKQDPAYASALDRALAFWAKHSKNTKFGTVLMYPGGQQGELNTPALVALACIEYLTVLRQSPDQAEKAKSVEKQLDGLLTFLISTRNAEGMFAGNYRYDSGQPFGAPNPYGDGEALLALTKATKLLGRADLQPMLVQTAETLFRKHVTEALMRDSDSDETKGFYQWGTMGFYELYTSGWPGTEPFAKRAIDLADWVINIHRILDRRRNTGYAYEGILHAHALAKSTGDEAHAKHFACVARQGIEELISWQVGGPIPNSFLRSHTEREAWTTGGVQNESSVPTLRIDVVQHQMHATQLALREQIAQ